VTGLATEVVTFLVLSCSLSSWHLRESSDLTVSYMSMAFPTHEL
jgi:hypothetical protein